ncbi:MAG TPA: NAD-dependent epimerase/dehydratase family protein [Fluviicoccus sp.]|nr:NAD-dependent epimerase/dehydratase family protein [Fluviicoccus sp.]
MSGKTAILIGATGLVGKQVLEKLLALPVYDKVIAVSRKPVTPHPKLQNLVVDFDHLAASIVNLHADDAFCCLGTTLKQAGSKSEFHKVDFGYNLEFAHAMRQNGCTHFLLVSALGAFPKSLVFYSRVKGLLEKDITTLEFPRFSIFRPSLLLGERGENRLAENLAARLMPLVEPFLRGPLRTVQPIQGAQVASAMVAVANLPAPDENPAVYYYDDMLAATAAFA